MLGRPSVGIRVGIAASNVRAKGGAASDAG